MNIIEEFKGIPGYEGLYQVSNLGNVKSLGNKATRKEKILKQNFSKGYYMVNLCKNSFKKSISIHVLVAMAFLDHKPNGTQKIVVDHINNNKLDNRFENLQLISHRENIEKYFINKKTSSKYPGVYFNKAINKWCSQVQIDGKSKNLGYYKDEYEAHLAYKKALSEINNLNLK